MDASWAALAAKEDPQGRGIGTLLVETRAGGGGRGGVEGEWGVGGGGGRRTRTVGGSIGNTAWRGE